MDPNCIFCSILRGETSTEFLYQDEMLVVFRDIRPQAPVHLLVVPRRHLRSINDLTEAHESVVSRMILVAGQMARQTSIARSGYKLLFNVERGGGQVIFHLHLHLLGGWR